MSLVSSSSLKTSCQVVNLPYDIINSIFEILSQMTDNGESGYYLEVTNRGKIRLMVRPSFTSNIRDLHIFKKSVTGRCVKLHIFQWTPPGSKQMEPEIVEAIERPHRIANQATIDENYRNGFVGDNHCYTFNEPYTGKCIVAYVESRTNLVSGNVAFHQGCVYYENGDCHVITGVGLEADGAATIVVNPLNMIWDVEGDDWADNMEAAEALLELGNGIEEEEEEEIDFDALASLPLLQMYM
jgi:hypothetical protein